ncbi:hypothetical protein HY633_04340 [Candidatus Uhrbacteria bacterium]|nr:hypothetical protein [Candidatus Uhrbacteria bacterium]
MELVMSDFTLGCGPAHRLEITLRKADWQLADVTKLTKNEDLCRQIRSVLLGHAKITVMEHVIDLDKEPFCPEGLYSTGKGAEHRKGGKLILTPGKIKLFLAEGQKNGGCLEGHKLREELVNQPVLNANALDYYWAHQELIPEEWKGKVVYFWGTIYRDARRNLFVRYLHRSGDRWVSGFRWLGGDFHGYRPAAVLASPAL